jgi:hypothetical protein
MRSSYRRSRVAGDRTAAARCCGLDGHQSCTAPSRMSSLPGSKLALQRQPTSSIPVQPGTCASSGKYFHISFHTERLRLSYKAYKVISGCFYWWAVLGSNQWPLPCESNFTVF